MNFGKFPVIGNLVVKEIFNYNVPVPAINYSKENELLYFEWENYDLLIIVHDEGIILMDRRESDENLLEYRLEDLLLAVKYQIQKLMSRLLNFEESPVNPQ